jgi:hypothetical protein
LSFELKNMMNVIYEIIMQYAIGRGRKFASYEFASYEFASYELLVTGCGWVEFVAFS